jgi:FkbM family methyltransferase
VSPIASLFHRAATNVALDAGFVTFTSLPIPWSARCGYLPRKYLAVLLNRRVVTFLGRSFRYDNRFMPALLQTYPGEIARLDRFVSFTGARRVMDVGANVGQFGFVLKSFFPHLEVCSFEPNPAAFALLSANAARHAGWRVFPFGLAPTTGPRDFYVVEGKSAQGSVFADNATLNLSKTDSTRIQVRLEHLSDAALAAHGIPHDFDLVKIDVEGFESDVIDSLDRIRWRYLYFELSLARSGGTTLDEVLHRIERASGARPRVVYRQKVPEGAPLADVILARE